MHHWQNLGAAIMLVSASIGAQAAEQNWTVEGSSLKIGRSCASTVDIQPNGAGHQVTVAASADKDEEIKKLHVTGGDIASIDVNGFDCYKPGWFGRSHPTLALTVKVPDGAAIEVNDGGVAHYTIGAVGGTLKLSLAGAGGLKAVGAKTLSLELSGASKADIGETGNVKMRTSGAGDVTIHTVKGTLEAKLAGAGNLTIDDIAAPSVDLHAAGRTDIKFGKGMIDDLTLDAAGASDVVVDAVVKDAKVSLAGAGDVRFAKLTGNINQSVAGVGKVTVVEH
ncbi:MAG TPA: DUF2807 domain-containing protein [Magnetospirillaceae bacterium]|nr:DUF2807 domain-containing protein [Magnetospirillaceae bacterium]